MNGRVNIMNNKGLSNYPLFESSHEIQDTNFLENIYESNDLQEVFFSSNNITYLHDEIVKGGMEKLIKISKNRGI